MISSRNKSSYTYELTLKNIKEWMFPCFCLLFYSERNHCFCLCRRWSSVPWAALPCWKPRRMGSRFSGCAWCCVSLWPTCSTCCWWWHCATPTSRSTPTTCPKPWRGASSHPPCQTATSHSKTSPGIMQPYLYLCNVLLVNELLFLKF